MRKENVKDLVITNDNNEKINVIDTREIAEMMGIEHKLILRKLEGTKDGKTKGIIPVLNENKIVLVDYFIESTYVDAKGETRKCYLCTRLGCDFLANKFTGEKGILFTAKYVKRFKEMEEALQEQQPKLPSTYKEALIQLLAQVEENEKLEQENKLLLEENKINKPKAEYFDDLVDKNLLTNFRDTAKELKLKQNEFINWLIENNYIYRDSKKKLKPKANHTPSLFEIKEWRKGDDVGVQTLITPRGRETFRLLLNVKN